MGCVFLMGFSGSGKTTIGKELEKRYSLSWADLDRVIEERAGKSVSEIIRVEGEEGFRALETEALESVLDVGVDVLSLGGGTPCIEQNQRLLEKSGLKVFLSTESEELLRRVETEQLEKSSGAPVRPLLASGKEEVSVERLENLLTERTPIYERVADLKVCTDWASPELIARSIKRALTAFGDGFFKGEQGGDSASVVSVPVGYGAEDGVFSEHIIGSGVRQGLAPYLSAEFKQPQKVALLIDEKVQEYWGAELLDGLSQQLNGLVSEELIPSGETSKSLALVEQYAERFVALELNRRDLVLACGGGVVGDFSGLLASVYMRGLGLAHLATTVVAQVDSAIGGKTAVNLPSGKNLLGTFYPAPLVFCDLDFLATLPEREYRAGLAEVVKYGLIYSEPFFEWLEENSEQILSREVQVLQRVVDFSLRTKLHFVVGDLEDTSGSRIFLNFGHTIGHALENLAGYGSYLHGEAVSIGMVKALEFGEHLGFTPKGSSKRASQLLEKLSLPVKLEQKIPGNAWKKAIGADKKRVSEQLQFVLLERVGKPFTHDVSVDSVLKVL